MGSRTAAGLVMAAAVLVALPAMAQETAKKGDATAANTAAGGAPAAQPAADEGAPAKRVTLTTGVDFVSAYMFRGIFQEDSGLIMPPYVDVGVALYNGDGAPEERHRERRLVEQHSLGAERQRQRLD